MVDARKTRFSKDELPALFAGARRLAVARGKSPLDGPPSPEALEAALGPSGNLRAPALRVGDTWLVGFDEALWLRVLGSR